MTACADCGRPGQRSTRCPRCAAIKKAEHDAAYGREYERERDKAVAAAGTHCPRCGRPYTADNPATGGHRVPVRHGGTTADGIEAQCRDCNYGWKRTGL